MHTRFAKLGIHIPHILMPREDIDISRWAVIACDQFTSNPAYWQAVAQYVGDTPSTLHLVLPEIDLAQSEQRIPQINQTMRQYTQDVLTRSIDGFVYVERETTDGLRRGLVMALDLEQYDYMPGAHTLVRSTEETVPDRLPPRVKIRTGAALELPHVLVLADDPDCCLIEPLTARKDSLTPVYDTELMLDGGRIRGWAVTGEQLLPVLEALEHLAAPETQQAKYPGIANTLLFAVGDGNHSLAAARSFWLQLRETLTPEQRANHPARYALVEINNVRDDAMAFAPIHRAMFNVDAEQLLAEFADYLAANRAGHGSQSFPWRFGDKEGCIETDSAPHILPVGTLQIFLDGYLSRHPEAKIDYIHGDEELETLSREGALGFALPPMDKAALFPAVLDHGALPRKTFSLGQATDKRYYLESRKLIP